ncbi:MAG: hypothetical protein WAK20_02630 [Candidatus Acidiferrum sp.]
MKTLPPFPREGPLLEGSASRTARPILRWFQQVQALAIPEYAAETPSGPVNGSNTRFLLITAAPNPPSSLQFYIEVAGAMILQPKSKYILAGQSVTFYTAPTGTAPYATYQY